ncbi:hypothetical protein B296_00039625 [Ensete ventricosum]|uniref:Uncharacterized protein n=1 Tax=Ensete ventricosum TaxID=4639 RepID=A0A426ZQH5_ENSVE|nr:hypothetical protein B296_00039625 [Ensete ventricosum]
MVYTIPVSAWTWLVRPRKASAVTISGAGFDAGEGNPGSVIILQKRLGVGTAAATSSVGRGCLLGMGWELGQMSGDSKLGLGGRLLEWWSPGQEEVLKFGSATDSCKKVRSGRFPT